jgi:ureidoglycolate lyase
MNTLPIEVLSAELFETFGDVISVEAARRHFTINQGYAERFDDLAHIDVSREGGAPRLSIFRALPRELPMSLLLMERHPLGSQAFMPLQAVPYLVVVCAGGDTPDLSTLRCFRAGPGQGVNYAAGTWHHPLLALSTVSDFLVIDRGGPQPNCDEVTLPAGAWRIEAQVPGL